MPNLQELIFGFAHACGIEEGYFDPRGNTIPQRMHNPLDLRHWAKPGSRLIRQPDGTFVQSDPWPEQNGYVCFPACEIPGCQDPDHPSETGWSAGRAQCRINIVKRGLTFRQFFAGKPGVYGGFAPSKDKNNPERYAQDVLERLVTEFGLDANLTIDQVVVGLASDGPTVAPAQAGQ